MGRRATDARANAPSSTHQPRLLAPKSAAGPSDGFNRTRTKAGRQTVPSAANIAIQRPGLPEAMISTDQNVERQRPRTGQAQIAGRWYKTIDAITQSGRLHHSTSGR